jgi:hypothetical protein
MQWVIKNEIKSITEEYRKEINRLTEEEIDYYSDIIYEYEPISRTFFEALLVRQVAVLERLVVSLYFDIYRLKTKDIDNNHILALDEKITKDKHFTDALKAAKYMKKLGLDITKIDEWKVFKKMRDLRNKLAHGVTIYLKKGEANEYNNFFKNKNLLIEEEFMENIFIYKLCDDLNNLLEMNEVFERFIGNINFEFQSFQKKIKEVKKRHVSLIQLFKIKIFKIIKKTNEKFLF